MGWQEYIPNDIADLYEIYDFKHAAAIISKEFPIEFSEICNSPKDFRFSLEDILR